MTDHSSETRMTFTAGSIDGVVLRPLSVYRDQRGWLTELYREDELSPDQRPVMAYVSETLPGVACGPHEHVDQTDYFAFIGPGDFDLYLWDNRAESATRGRRMTVRVGESNKQCVVIPSGVVHAYKNVSSTPGWVFNAPNRLYAGPGKKSPVDEIRHENRADSPYQLDSTIALRGKLAKLVKDSRHSRCLLIVRSTVDAMRVRMLIAKATSAMNHVTIDRLPTVTLSALARIV